MGKIEKQELIEKVAARRDQMVQDMIAMSSIPAINPRMEGAGEYQRIQWLISVLDKNKVPYEVVEVPDSAVPEGKRLTILVKMPGTEDTEKTLWFIAHVDTVNTGDLDAWKTDPLKPQLVDGRIYGLGVEDNSQAVICALHAAILMQETGLRAKCNVGFMFASDEETGSEFGLKALLKQGLFSPKDEAVVPDGGSPDGSFVEIAEKSILWTKFTVIGKQAHGSMPHLGINACSVGMHFAVELEDTLKQVFAYKDKLFDPPYSTFELTQKYANVSSPNVLPGKDVFCMDMRILPKFTVDEVLEEVNKLIARYEYAYKVKIEYEFPQRVDAPAPTSPDATIVQKLVEAISETGVTAYYGGIGGGTCAAILREENIPAVVWGTLDELAHQPNEYVIIDNIVRDTGIFLATILKYC